MVTQRITGGYYPSKWFPTDFHLPSVFAFSPHRSWAPLPRQKVPAAGARTNRPGHRPLLYRPAYKGPRGPSRSRHECRGAADTAVAPRRRPYQMGYHTRRRPRCRPPQYPAGPVAYGHPTQCCRGNIPTLSPSPPASSLARQLPRQVYRAFWCASLRGMSPEVKVSSTPWPIVDPFYCTVLLYWGPYRSPAYL
jgi:hypothetical protein